MRIFGFHQFHVLSKNARGADMIGALLFGALLGLRLLFANEDFSYDYAAYLYYFELLSDYSFLDVMERVGDLFPYVLLPRAPIFEFGFVLMAKAIQLLVVTPTATYAALAAMSLGLRAYVMRRLGCSWIWIFLSQIYVVTLLEANAIRVGMAVTIVLYGLYAILIGRSRLGWAVLFLSLAIHLQALLFVLPFLAVWPLRRKLEQSRPMLLALAVAMAVMIIGVMSTGLLAGHEKLSDYTVKESSSGGLTIISVSALIFLVCALFMQPNRRLVSHEKSSRLMWISISMAIVPSVVIYTAITSIAVIGDRAWQFSFVIFASLIYTNWTSKKQKTRAAAVLTVLALISAVNVTLRYPLSNLFDFVLPHVEIEAAI